MVVWKVSSVEVEDSVEVKALEVEDLTDKRKALVLVVDSNEEETSSRVVESLKERRRVSLVIPLRSLVKKSSVDNLRSLCLQNFLLRKTLRISPRVFLLR